MANPPRQVVLGNNNDNFDIIFSIGAYDVLGIDIFWGQLWNLAQRGNK